MKSIRALIMGGLLLALCPAQAKLVINEVFYHAPDDLTDLQWIELYNTSDESVDISGWRLAKALKFTFKPGSTIAPHGYLVLCKDLKVFRNFYDVPIAGEFNRALKHSGERLELRTPTGNVEDSIEFGNRAPWASGPDGKTASLERICPTGPGDQPSNWAGSPLSDDATRPGGTPGRQNAAFCATVPPVIDQVRFPANWVPPQQSMRIEAVVQSAVGLKKVQLLYRVVQSGSLGEETSVPMSKDPATARYSANIPGQQAGQVVRFRLQAVDENSAERFVPSPTDLRPAFSILVFTNGTPAKLTAGYFIHTDADEVQSALRQLQNGGRAAPTTPEGQAKFMAQMQFRAALDLPQLWTALTITNCEAAGMEKLRSAFLRQEQAVTALEKQATDIATPADAGPKISEVTKSFKSTLITALDPLLNVDQKKAFEKWRDTPAGQFNPGGMGNNPLVMLRQFIRLEPGYLHLAANTNLTTVQLLAIRDVYREAIEQRDAMAPDLQRLMSNRDNNQQEGEKFQAKAEALPGVVEKKLRQTLTSPQARQFAAWQLSQQPPFMRHTRTKSPEPVLGESAFIMVDPQTGDPTLFDFVRIPERSGGWKVHFGKDQSWRGMSVVDIIFESSARWLLAEPLAYDMHRRAGVLACRTDFLRLTVDGQPAGYYLLIEQVNKAFFRNSGLRDDGNLYKANWVGNGLVGQHDKHINRPTGHDDLVKLVGQLEKTKSQPDEQWALIRREFDVEQVINHYAVRTLISDWDGFFNNYWLYHDIHGSGKWTFYPWDEDKTWGEYDGWENEGVLYNMPLTYGAEGDHPPGEAPGRPSTSYGFRQWWRAGGYVSRPLLANPVFRKHFVARLKQLLETEFTEARLFPLIDGFKDQLGGEIEYRAQLSKEDPQRAQKAFQSNLDSFKEFIRKRRQWLLEQEEVRSAGTFDHSQL
jgi:hypothetical protein